MACFDASSSDPCKWCQDGGQAFCTPEDDCTADNVLTGCAAIGQDLVTIWPPSGHIEGGTRLTVTINKALIGITFKIVNITIGGRNCKTRWKETTVTSLETQLLTNLVCVTPNLAPLVHTEMPVRLPVTVIVEILGVNVVLNQTNVEFEAVTPEVNSVNQLDSSRLFTNGTEITIHGSYLYAGEVSVQFEDTHALCIIT